MSVLEPGDAFPAIEFNMVGGGTKQLHNNKNRWTLLITYRGHHCPRCKTYVAKLHTLVQKYADREVDIYLASMDPEAVAQKTISENNWTLPVAHSMSADEARQLALYLTPHDDGAELSGPYSEAGMFLINPEGLTQALERSNSPSIRPDLDVVLDGIIGTQDRNLPIRGLYEG